jgi:hypothetical protein
MREELVAVASERQVVVEIRMVELVGSRACVSSSDQSFGQPFDVF